MRVFGPPGVNPGIVYPQPLVGRAPGSAGFIYPTLISDQSSLLRDTTLRIACPAGGAVTIDWGDGTSSAVTCNGVLQVHTHTYGGLGIYTIRVLGTVHLITDFRCYAQSWVSGDIASMRGLTNLTILNLRSTAVSGDIAALSGLVDLTVLYLFSTAVSGDIAALSGLVELTVLYLYSTSVSGDIASLSGLTNLTVLYLHTTAITGDISALSGLVDLTILSLHTTTITGDIASLSGLVDLTGLYLYSTSVNDYTSTPLPAWPGCNIRIYNLGLSSTEIDNFLVDLADGVGAGGSLTYIVGNDPRTAASDAAVAALSAAGWGGDIP
jgi:hypothetical protein